MSDEQEPIQPIDVPFISLDAELITERVGARIKAELSKREQKLKSDDEEKPEPE